MISMYSRVRVMGLPYSSPYQPSATCGPDGPMPSRNRPPDMVSSVIAVIAVHVGVRAGICMMAVPTLMRWVSARIQAAGDTASEPQASAVQTLS